MAAVPYKPYQPGKNGRKITLLALGAAIIIIAGVFVARAFLKHQPATDEVNTAFPPQMPIPVQPPAPVNEPAQAKTEPNSTALLSETAKLISQGKADIAAGEIIKARDGLSDALSMLTGKPQAQDVKALMAELAQNWLFSKEVAQGDSLCSVYVVKPGDLLQKVCSAHKIPYELIMELNDIQKASSLRAGQKIKMVNGPFHCFISRSAFTMDLYLQNTYVRTYKVGLGTEGRETPTGIWRVAPAGKMIMPPWTDPDTQKRYTSESPDYPLGARWIALDGIGGSALGRTGFAIHGTNQPLTIGTKSSRGCIRLHDGDVIQIYKLLVPVHSEVRVVD